MAKITHDDCFMYKKDSIGAPVCTGNIDNSVCGMSCPFRHTPEEQKAIEKVVLDRFKKEDVYLYHDYRSRLTGDLLKHRDV